MARLNPHIEWAGVAVRMADGTVYAFEMEGLIVGEIRLEHDLGLDDTTFADRTIGPIRTDVHVELHGRGIHSTRFADSARQRQHAIEPALPAIEAQEDNHHG